MSERQHLALTRCFFCGEPDRILLCKRYRPDGQPVTDMAEFHDKIIDKEPCPKCADLMKQGVMFLVVKDGESGDNPARTGELHVVKDEAVKRLLEKSPELLASILKSRMTYIEESVARKIGMEKPQPEPTKE